MARWALALVLVTGCASPGSECNGAAPAFADCTQGIAWADCGGTGSQPRFACDGGDCRWFSNDCVAQGYEASSCDASQMCCHANAPYDGPLTGSPRDFGVSAFTLGWGTEPWDSVRDRSLTVTVGATSSATRPSVDCVGTSVCERLSIPSWGERDGVITGMLMPTGPTFAGYRITFELIPDGAGTMGARVCAVPFSDAASNTCVQPEATTFPRACATTGAVRIDALPVTAHTQFDIDATFADGSTVSLRI